MRNNSILPTSRVEVMTAMVSFIGFIPMAMGHGTSAEMQEPLATIVIGGLLSSTLLALFVWATLYNWFEKDELLEVAV